MSARKGLKHYIKCFVDPVSIHPWEGTFKEPFETLHRIAREEKSRLRMAAYGEPPPRLIFKKEFQVFMWVLFSIWQSVKLFLFPQRVLNGNRFRDFLDIPRTILFALRFNYAPSVYYLYNLHKIPRSDKDLGRYITAWEGNLIFRRISRIRGSDVGAIDNKDRFEGFCNQHQLPTIQLLQLSQNGQVQLQPRDLFAKTIFGHSGEGCILLTYDTSRNGWMSGKELVKADKLKPFLQGYFGDDRFILQYRVRNHPELHWLSEQVLTTMRVLSAWDPDGSPVLLRATIRIPVSPDAIMDNSSQGGMSAPVNPASGIIYDTATRWNQEFTGTHPMGSNRSLLGFQLPLWDDTRNLILKAHVAASNYNFLGWDVAISEKGPLLVECNVWSDVDLVQVPQKEGFLTDEVMACFMAEPSLEKDFKTG